MKITSIKPGGKYSNEQIEKSVFGILRDNKLCSIACVKNTEDGPKAHISTAFYCYSDDFTFYVLTDPKTQHGQNLEENDSVAVAINNSEQSWDKKKQGLQLFGTMKKVPLLKMPGAFAAYVKEYPGLLRYLTSPTEVMDKLDSRFYMLCFSKMKIFDEPLFGDEVWIDVRLGSFVA